MSRLKLSKNFYLIRNICQLVHKIFAVFHMLCRLLLVALLTKLFPPFAIASSLGVVQLIVLQSVYNASLSAVTEQSTDELDETLTYDINIFWWETILIQSKPFLY